MQRAKDITKIVLMAVIALSVGAVAVFVCLRLHQLGEDEAAEREASVQLQQRASDDVHVFQLKLSGTLTGVDAQVAQLAPVLKAASKLLGTGNATASKLNAALDEINRDCDEAKTQKPCGTLADFAKMLKTFRGAAGQVEVAARHENENLSTLDTQEAQLFADTHGDLVALAKTLADADGVITDPATKQAQKDAAGIVANLNGITHDGKVEADKLVAPQPWWRKSMGYGNVFARVAICAASKATCTL
jgi:hypothetical protein